MDALSYIVLIASVFSWVVVVVILIQAVCDIQKRLTEHRVTLRRYVDKVESLDRAVIGFSKKIYLLDEKYASNPDFQAKLQALKQVINKEKNV